MPDRNHIPLRWLGPRSDYANQLLFYHRQRKANFKIILDALDAIALRNHTDTLSDDPCKYNLGSRFLVHGSYVIDL